MNAFLAHGYCSANTKSVVWPAVMMSTVILALSLVTSPASAIPKSNVDGNGHLRLDSSGGSNNSQAIVWNCHPEFADQLWMFPV